MAEELLRQVSAVVIAFIEATGAVVISVGALWAALRFVVGGVRRRGAAVFVPIRLSLGRFLTLGLEFQLAADILRTAAAPSFPQIGQLAAIAAIRTALNYVLRREAEHEQRQVRREADQRGARAAAGHREPDDQRPAAAA